MRLFQLISIVFAIMFTSCAVHIPVKTDYDTKATFNSYTSFAFYKPGIDAVEINDLDKKRILRAIDQTLQQKGFTKSETPDLLVNIKTEAEKNVNVYQNNGFGYGFGWGWYHPYWWGGFNGFNNFNTTYQTVEGILYIDLIDAKTKELVWYGTGRAALVDGPEAKEARIQAIVSAILAKYPPEAKK